MALDLYYNVVSQPCRSVLMFLRLNNIEYKSNLIDFRKGDHKTPEFLAMNPNHSVPVMKDNDGFIITQSVVMVKYLAAKHKTPDHWYPADLKKRTKVDELLDWHHTNIRKHGVGVFIGVLLGPILYGRPALTPEQEDEKYQELDGSLAMIEAFLKDQKFLCGDDISIADIFIANEILQPTMCERDIFEKRPKVKAWMDRVEERVNPVWDEFVDQFKQIVSGIKSDNKTPEFLAMNPNHSVPVMKDNDSFIITQSVVMVKYLAAKHKTPDHWYPADLKKRTKVDELLDWHHTNIRKHGVGVFIGVLLSGPRFGRPSVTPEQIEERYQELDRSLAMIQEFLKDQKFLCGDEITIADIFIANEILQPTMCERDIFEKRPKVKAWMNRVQERLNPVWDEFVDQFKQIVSKYKSMAK